MEKDKLQILLLEDEEDHAVLIGRAFENFGRKIMLVNVKSLREAREWLATSTPDLMIADFLLPDGKGLEILSNVGAKPTFPVVLMTSYGDEQLAVEAIKAGALDYVVKSENTLMDMAHIIERSLREWKHIKEKEKAEEEKKQLEMQLFRSQKLEAIGTLAGGIAHDFNNVLGGIVGYTEMALQEENISAMARYNMKQVLSAANRAKDLVKQILAISRKAETTRKVLLLQPVIREAARLLRATLPAFVDIRQEIDESVGTVQANSSEIHQVLMNLGTNAWQAMEKNGGVIELKLTQEEAPSGEGGRMAHTSPSNRYAKITVTDTGTGIRQELLDRIFDPYFTTKEKGKGTGLGLAVVQGIVRNHNGAINVKSALGKGTTFEILFPVVTGEDQVKESVEEKNPIGTEHILLVDDEQIILDVGMQMLKSLGYHVDARFSPVEALDLFRKDSQTYDMVITDLAMQEMNGISFAEELRKIRPDVPIILCTGYDEKIDKIMNEDIGLDHLIMKPFSLKDMANTIREVLDRQKAA